jgi:anti-sigma-K factor RskA
MAGAMSHEEARVALGAAALDTLSDEEQRAVLLHAATCTDCEAELAALRATASSLAYVAPAASLEPERSAALRSRLLARATADATTRAHTRERSGIGRARTRAPEGAPEASRVRWPAITGTLGAALAASLVVAALLVGRERNAMDSLRTQLGVSAVRIDSLTAALAAQHETLADITGPDVGVITLTAAGQRAPGALMFWDRARNRWTMFAHNLPTLGAGRTYQLWLVTDAAKISAGTFASDSAGSAVVRAEHALAPGTLRAVAVTDEPAGGVPQPTGDVVLVGSTAR